MLVGFDFWLWLLRLGMWWRLPVHSFGYFCGRLWLWLWLRTIGRFGFLVVVMGFLCILLDFWLWLWVSCAFFWIFYLVVGGVDGGGFRVCCWWW